MIEPFSVETAAPLLRCSEYTVRELCRAGRLPGIKLGEDWIIPAGALFTRLDEIAIEEATSRRAASFKPKAILHAAGAPRKSSKTAGLRPVLPTLINAIKKQT